MDNIIYAIYTRDPLNKNAQLGDCITDGEGRDNVIRAAADHFREEMLEDGEAAMGEYQRECLLVYEEQAGGGQWTEKIVPVTVTWVIDYDDVHGKSMRDEHFSQRDYL